MIHYLLTNIGIKSLTMGFVDLSQIDLYTLIIALWRNMKVAAFFGNMHRLAPPEPTKAQIDEALEYGHIDYLNGRCIKTDFSDLKRVDTSMYNLDAGPNAFEDIVAKITNNK